MIRLLWKCVCLALMLGVLGVGFYFFHGVMLRPVGRHLIAADPLEKADYLVLLAGAPYLTAPEAARLYHEGWAPAILITNQPRPPGQDALLRLGVPVKDRQEVAKDILAALRVPAQAVHPLPVRSSDVRDELVAVRQFLAGRASRAVIVITPKRQSGRAKHLCTEALAPAIVCRSRPAGDDPFDPAHWWSDWRQVGDVASEYAALAVDLGRTWWQRFLSPAAVPPAVTIR